ncbi:hypothetical protein AB0G76_22350 [Streptomyces asoensis]|uniref:hypothetical protein n=1 Tax=Streptomyces asoensis TaxID=249586 RepID=UPI0033E824AC
MYDQTRAQQPADRPSDSAGQGGTGPQALLPSDGRAEIARRLGHAVNTFADSPREALEEAEGAFDAATAQLADALAERRRVLHAGWADLDPETRSAELRFALREYREITGRLLRV